MNIPMSKPILHYYNIADGITAFTTTRHGGESKGSLGELNINTHRGDDPAAVETNLNALANELNIPANRIVRQHQVHETENRQITEAFFSLPIDKQKEMLEGSDALITNLKNACIGVFTADCVPVLLYDSIHQCTAAIHAGWKGTVKRIVRATVQKLTHVYGTKPEDLKAVIGPCISLRNFEVGQEVYDSFMEAQFEMEKIAQRYEKWHINLPLANELELLALGVKKENIHQSGICTFDQHKDYFSARRLKDTFGTIYTGIIIR